MPYAKTSLRAEQRALREQMTGLGMSRRQIAVEFGRRYRLRPRAAWRSAHGWSLTEAAERISAYAAQAGLGKESTVAMTGAHLCEHENWPGEGPAPTGRRPTPYLLALLAAVYGCEVEDLLDPSDYAHMPATDRLVLDKTAHSDTPEPAIRPAAALGDHLEAEDPLRRRSFVGLAGTSLLASVLDLAPDRPSLSTEPLVAVLTGQAPDPEPGTSGPPPGAAQLSAAVSEVRRQYQACRYSALISQLPQLLSRLEVACLTLEGNARERALALSADAYHVTGGLSLKLGDQGLAFLAADRSMRAALSSEDPVTIGASARILTHALMSGGHLAAAVSTARAHADRLDRAVPSHTPESLSVYGSLLLRGAVASARQDDRANALELLDEADLAGQQLGTDRNLRWTAFGPTNARLHRVNIAVGLGDAGTAVDVARRIDLNVITVTERKATLLIDIARAYLQWGRHDKAYIALRAARHVAPEEVIGRPSAHRLIRQLAATAPPTIRRDVMRFAAEIGVTP